jgi:transcriptional regulator with XRE-family HTH domain
MQTLSGKLLREAREASGLTQAELADRLGTNQSSVARLESPRSNPRLSTLERALAATGNQLELSVRAATYPGIDESMIRASLARTPAERLATFAGSYRGLRRLAPTVRS